MRGQILGVEPSVGVLLAANDERLEFPLSEWRSAGAPQVGQWVDFVHENGGARAVYALPTHAPAPGTTSTGASNSFVLGAVGVGCLVVGLVIPVIPTLAALLFGLLGAAKAREENDSTGLTLSRIAWIGALVLIGLGILLFGAAIAFLGGMADLWRQTWPMTRL